MVRGFYTSLLPGNDGKQKVGGAASPGVEHVGAGVVVSSVMRVRKAAHPVARLDVEPDAMALLEDHAGRPDLDVDANHFVGLQPLAVFMHVVRPVGQGQRRIELSVRRCAISLRTARTYSSSASRASRSRSPRAGCERR